MFMLLGQNSNSVASLMRQGIVVWFGVEGFWFQELYRMIVVKSVIGYCQLLRFLRDICRLFYFFLVSVDLPIYQIINLHEM